VNMLGFNVHGKRVGRIAFGVVLLAGAAILVQRLASLDEPQSRRVILTTWAVAFAAYAIAGRLGSRRVLDHAGELAVPALVVPSVGAALLLPLTLHMPFAMLVAPGAGAFDDWAVISAVITGPTHLVFAALAGERARQLAASDPAQSPLSPLKIYGICVAVSCLPFALLVIPPFLVMMTGLPMLGGLALMDWLAARDRLAATAEAVPRAIAMR
jgi:hypothetical protein